MIKLMPSHHVVQVTAATSLHILHKMVTGPGPKRGEPGFVDPHWPGDSSSKVLSKGAEKPRVEAPSKIESVAADDNSAAGEQLRVCMCAMAALWPAGCLRDDCR